MQQQQQRDVDQSSGGVANKRNRIDDDVAELVSMQRREPKRHQLPIETLAAPVIVVAANKRNRIDADVAEITPEHRDQLQQHPKRQQVTAECTMQRPGRAWGQIAEAMAKFYAAEARGTRARQSLRAIDEEITDPLRLGTAAADVELSAINAQRTAGDDRYTKILRILDSFEGVERHENQKLWHWWMIVACLSHIYGADWQNASTRVLRSLGLKEIRTEILVMTPRRFGKTWSVAMIVCALLLSVPGFRIVVISPGSRTSGKMLEEIKRMMSRLKGADRHICGHDTTKMYVSVDPLPQGAGVKSEYARQLRTMSTTSVIEVLPDNPEGTHAPECMQAPPPPHSPHRTGINQNNTTPGRGECILESMHTHRPARTQITKDL